MPAGKWLTGAIHLHSNVNLHQEEGAEIHFSDDPADYLPVVFTENVIARGLTILTKQKPGGPKPPNTDGLNLDSSRNVLVEHCLFDVGDDAVCLKSGINEDGRRVGRPTENVVVLRNSDRLFWTALCAMWSRWTKVLVIVQPQTVVRWHQAGFRLFWRWRSRRRSGRTPKDRELIDLIRRMWQANPTWGSPRIQAELAKLGLQVSAATVRKYRPKGERGPPSQSWRAFLRNHTKQLIAIDFFTVPTVTFRVLFVFVVLAHERRRVLHFAVTDAPSAHWAGQQIVNAFPYATPPKYLLRDRDGIYGAEFTKRVVALGIEDKPIAPSAPWQNPYVERLIGTIRRECLDRVIIIGERHLHTVLENYFEYDHHSRPHRSLAQDCPVTSPVLTPEQGRVVEIPQVGGLHYQYTRQAA